MADHDQDSIILLNGLDDSRRAILTMLDGMRRTLCLYTPLLRPEFYDDPAILAAIRSRVVNQPKLRLQLVLPPAREWRSACPGLLRLADRLTSALILRTPIPGELPDRPELGQAFVIVDERVLLRFIDPRRLLGEYQPQSGERTKELLELFREVWNRSQPDPDLGRLGI
jgi:hypothetical protein